MALQGLNSEAYELLDILENRKGPKFSKRFGGHLFFDLDMRFDQVIIGAIRELALNCVGASARLALFSNTQKALLGWLEFDDDWPSMIAAMSDQLVESGDYNGLVLIDTSRRFVAYQDRPVDMGVVAFDADIKWHSLSEDARDCFTLPKDIEAWLDGRSDRDVSLASYYGREFLAALLKDYE